MRAYFSCQQSSCDGDDDEEAQLWGKSDKRGFNNNKVVVSGVHQEIPELLKCVWECVRSCCGKSVRMNIVRAKQKVEQA